jgi:hypothetical protein
MIRRDYIMRLVQEMAQILTRVRSLKQRQEYESAIGEIEGALRQVADGRANEFFLEEWISVCRKQDQAASALMVAVAELINEQSDILAVQNNAAERQSRALALGLYLEAILAEDSFVSLDMVGKVAQMIDATVVSTLPGPVLRRLVHYFVACGQFAKAEDTLFAWLETGDPEVRAVGVTFYQHLMALPSDELERGGLPRSEVEQGRTEFDAQCRAALNGAPSLPAISP